jgi:hypothetical protein
MNLISPEASQLFRIIVGAIITTYIVLILWTIREILFACTLSYIQKTCWILLIVFLPFWGMIIYNLNNSKGA